MLFPVWPRLALLVVPAPKVTLLKSFDDFVRVFGGPVMVWDADLPDDPLRAEIKDQHGNVVGTMESKSAGYFPRPTVRVVPASNGDPGCCDIIMEQGGLVLEHHKNKALDLDHPSVPQWERDAAEEERREYEDED